MLDHNKRRTLKILGVTPLMSIPVFASIPSLGLAATTQVDATKAQFPAPVQSTQLPVQIQIIDTQSVPDNNVVVRNNSDESLLICRFMPGHVYFNYQIMDLNEAVGMQPLSLKPGQSKAFKFNVWPVINAGPVEYIRADHAVEVLTADTSVITLGAFMADTKAVLQANSTPVVTS